MITTILVGVPWLLFYNFLALNLPFGMIAIIIGIASGFGSETSCQENQTGRALFLQLQLISLFVFPLWN